LTRGGHCRDSERGRISPAVIDEEDSVAGFVQVIEWKTSRIDEVQKLNDEWRERFPEMGPSRVIVCSDRDNDGSYMTIVEFSSYEAAMENSKDPATSEFAEKMGALTDGPPVFHNLDIVRDESRS
jgi:quinol monooxygenase YgiN